MERSFERQVETDDSPSGEFPDEWEEIVQRFEQAWLNDERPEIELYLPTDDVARRGVLPQLVHADLEFRLKAKLLARVEDYLRRFVELAEDSAFVGQLLQAEYQLRRRFEPLLSPAEYSQRFPQWAAFLPALLGSERSQDDTQIYIPDSLSRAGDFEAVNGRTIDFGQSEWSDFEVRDELGRGGMGVVHLAWQRSLERLVAIKTLHPFVVRSDDILKRFRQEAIAAAQLYHPNIVRVMSFGEVSGTPFYVMEYVAGGNLAQRLNGTPWAANEAARLIATLARAAHFAHQRHLLHRDLKPSNILIGADGTPTISDFGLAKRLGQDSKQTSFGMLLGTPSYMSPEQASGSSSELTAATDIYSLGAILYELLTGRPPVIGNGSSVTLETVRTTEPTAPRTLAKQTPIDLETICLKSLRRNPVDRYPSANELADDIQRFLDGLPIQAKRSTSWGKLRSWCRRQPLTIGLCLAVAVLLAVLVTWLPEVRSSSQKSQEAQTRLDDARKHFLDAHNAVRAVFNGATSKTELARARNFYAGFLTQHVDDAELRLECAMSRYALGKICDAEKDFDAALTWWKQADQSFEQLGLDVVQANDETLHWYTVTQQVMAEEFCRRKEFEPARICYEKAQKFLERRLLVQPDDAVWRHRLAYCQRNQYRLAGNGPDNETVLGKCEAAVATWRDLVATKAAMPTQPQDQMDSYRDHLMMGLRCCGKVLITLERYGDAIARYQEMLAIDQHRQNDSTETQYSDLPFHEKRWRERVLEAHDGIAKSHYQWGKKRLNDSRPEEAVSNYDESIRHWEIIIASGDATTSQRWYFASSHFHLAIAYRRQGLSADAQSEYQTAAGLWEPMLADKNLKGFNRELTESHLRESHVEIKKIQDASQ